MSDRLAVCATKFIVCGGVSFALGLTLSRIRLARLEEPNQVAMEHNQVVLEHDQVAQLEQRLEEKLEKCMVRILMKQASPTPVGVTIAPLPTVLHVCHLPECVKQPVYEAAWRLAWEYRTAGVEGDRHGHTLVLGVPDELFRFGTRHKFDPFRAREGSILCPDDVEEVRRCMNADGMTLIDGVSGAPVANKFFATGLSDCAGGARSRSSLWMAKSALCVVIRISQDGKVALYMRSDLGSALACHLY